MGAYSCRIAVTLRAKTGNGLDWLIFNLAHINIRKVDALGSGWEQLL